MCTWLSANVCECSGLAILKHFLGVPLMGWLREKMIVIAGEQLEDHVW